MPDDLANFPFDAFSIGEGEIMLVTLMNRYMRGECSTDIIGKLLGADGGGFLLFYCPKDRRDGLGKTLGLEKFDFVFEHDGSSVIYIGDKYWV